MSLSNVLRWKALTSSFILSLVLGCAAQNGKLFGWKFNAQNGFSTSLPTCQRMPIVVQPWNISDPALFNATGVPPYFMLAIPAEGTPRVYPVGSDPQQLSWVVDFPVSTELALTIIDSNNTAGGIPSTLFKVLPGGDEGCIVAEPSDPTFTLKANVTGEIPTCAPWGVEVDGGVPPYNWTLAQLSSPIVTNVTGRMDDDEMVYIMRGDQHNKLFVAASDATGRWARGVGMVIPKGSDNVECVGLVTVTGNSTEFAAQLKAHNDKLKREKRNRTIAIAVPVSIVGAILLGVIIWFLVKNHRKRMSRRPHVFNAEPKIEMTTPMDVDFTPYTGYRRNTVLTYDSSGRPISSAPTSPTGATFSKGSETMLWRQSELSQDNQFSRFSQAGSSSGNPTSPSSSDRPTSRFHEEDEAVYQHVDAGGVRELPPPYADRSGGRRAPRNTKLTPQNETEDSRH